MTYNTFIYIVGALSTGGLIWFIGDRVRQITKANINLFSWQGFTDTVNAIAQAIGLKRERRQSIEAFIEEMTAVDQLLTRFKGRYQDPRHLQDSFNAVTLGEARQYATQIYELLSKIQAGVGRIEIAVAEATNVTAAQINLQAMAPGLGASLPKSQGAPALPAAPQSATTPMGNSYAARANAAPQPAADGAMPFKVKIDDTTMYTITDFTEKAPYNRSNMLGLGLKQYIAQKNLIIGENVTFWPATYIKKGEDASTATASQSQSF